MQTVALRGERKRELELDFGLLVARTGSETLLKLTLLIFYYIHVLNAVKIKTLSHKIFTRSFFSQ